MEYERVHKVQMGIISPTKLRLKLLGPHHQRRKDGSNSNSSRTSPSKLEDTEFVKNSLLASKNGDFDEEAPSLEASAVKLSIGEATNSSQRDHILFHPKDILPNGIGAVSHVAIHHLSRDGSGNSSTVQPMRVLEEDNLDYDSNASSSSFEFHKGERSLHNTMVRAVSRPMPSKWNDAEKWILNRKPTHPTHSKKINLQSQVNRLPVTSLARVAPESASCDHKASSNPVIYAKQEGSCHPTSQIGVEKFSFAPSGPSNATNAAINHCSFVKDEKEIDPKELSHTERPIADTAVSMRDMGTEMTPVTSQEPSMTSTPIGATTPLRSPISSIPSTPRRGAPASTPLEVTNYDESECQKQCSRKELSEQELKLKTRREIVALGVQLGKINIAAWASKNEKEKNASSVEITDAELGRIEFENRAAAWQEAENSKHTARYKREEIKIQAWESHQKAKVEAEMKRIEIQVEQRKAYAQEKMIKKIATARQRSEEKRAAAEAKRNEQATKSAAQADYIRQTGRIPSSHFVCCGWFS
ncbi:hypothetical protein HHK36_004897 [Tetracentron sinense]|uniref:Remorin C-terminal domain-containing protein n=1 Tax=Tetracentron sinense TaxID=13715 RepID=A0A835DLU7_TETSI|nr:hypothetical protein HHK36_004897 [Tetracentron sinense]